jgi:hypothetical protein
MRVGVRPWGLQPGGCTVLLTVGQGSIRDAAAKQTTAVVRVSRRFNYQQKVPSVTTSYHIINSKCQKVAAKLLDLR